MNYKEFDAQLGEILRTERERRGLSQREIARRIGVSKSAVSLWESGARSMAAVSLAKYCAVLGVSIEYIFGKIS